MSPRRKPRKSASDRRIAALQGQAAADSADKLGLELDPETGEPITDESTDDGEGDESTEGKARSGPPENKRRSGAESKS